MTTTPAIGYRENLPISDPAALVDTDVKVPDPDDHDLLVEVQAVSVNPVDVKLRAGAPTSELRTLGFDAAGTVVATGPAVTLFRPGDEVYYAGSIARPGSNQRLHLVDERITGRKPATLSFADAASLPLVSLTAWECLLDRLALTPGSSGSVLVVGATGGVGALVLQLAEALLPGVTVVATASSPERAAWARELGAEHTVDHRGDLATQVLDLVPDGVDRVVTAHSEGQIPVYAEIVRPFGQIVAIDDGERDVSPLKAKSIAWHWELMFTRALHQTDDLRAQHDILDEVASLVEAGRVRPTVSRRLGPISAATLREAHELVETGRTLGTVVVHGWP